MPDIIDTLLAQEQAKIEAFKEQAALQLNAFNEDLKLAFEANLDAMLEGEFQRFSSQVTQQLGQLRQEIADSLSQQTIANNAGKALLNTVTRKQKTSTRSLANRFARTLVTQFFPESSAMAGLGGGGGQNLGRTQIASILAQEIGRANRNS